MEKFDELTGKYKLPFGLTLVGLVLIAGGMFSSNLFTKPKTYPKASLVSPSNVLGIKVDVAGAVEKPGVYTLSLDARVEDGVKAAGGFNALASSTFIARSLNLSQKLTDGSKVYIPFEGETAGGVSGVQNSGKIGLNSSTQSQLEALPAVGPATALKIIASRPYSGIDDLLGKKVISRAVFEKIKDLVDVN